MVEHSPQILASEEKATTKTKCIDVYRRHLPTLASIQRDTQDNPQFFLPACLWLPTERCVIRVEHASFALFVGPSRFGLEVRR